MKCGYFNARTFTSSSESIGRACQANLEDSPGPRTLPSRPDDVTKIGTHLGIIIIILSVGLHRSTASRNLKASTSKNRFYSFGSEAICFDISGFPWSASGTLTVPKEVSPASYFQTRDVPNPELRRSNSISRLEVGVHISCKCRLGTAAVFALSPIALAQLWKSRCSQAIYVARSL